MSSLPPRDALRSSLEALRAVALPAGLAEDGDEWTPAHRLAPSLWELFCSADDAAGEALALAFAQRRLAPDACPQWLWVQDAQSVQRSGRPYAHGLPPSLRAGLLHVEARTAADALWAMEEGVRCGALSFVVGELLGDPKALDFTATRRLVLAAERIGVPLYLVRREGFANLSAARLRWTVEAAPSSLHRWNAHAPGPPVARAELFRGRGLRPGRFMLSHGVEAYDEPGHRLALAAQSGDRPLEPAHRRAG